MFGLEYILALIKILFQIAFALVTALPAKLAWNCFAPIYLDFIPKLYQSIPYWHMVAFLLVVSIASEIVEKLTPKFVSITQTNS